MQQQSKSLVIHVLTGHAISNGKFYTFHCEKQRVMQPRVLLQKKRKQTAEVNIFLLKPTSVNSCLQPEKQECCSVAGRILLFSCLYIKSKTSMYLTNASSECIQNITPVRHTDMALIQQQYVNDRFSQISPFTLLVVCLHVPAELHGHYSSSFPHPLIHCNFTFLSPCHVSQAAITTA